MGAVVVVVVVVVVTGSVVTTLSVEAVVSGSELFEVLFLDEQPADGMTALMPINAARIRLMCLFIVIPHFL